VRTGGGAVSGLIARADPRRIPLDSGLEDLFDDDGRAVFCRPSRSTKDWEGQGAWFLPAAVMTAFVIAREGFVNDPIQV